MVIQPIPVRRRYRARPADRPGRGAWYLVRSPIDGAVNRTIRLGAMCPSPDTPSISIASARSQPNEVDFIAK